MLFGDIAKKILIGGTMCENDEKNIFSFIEKMNPGLVVFDFDGTLVYTEDLHWKYYHDVLAEDYGIDYPFSDHHLATGKHSNDIWKMLGKRYDLDFSESTDVYPNVVKFVSGMLHDLDRPCFSYVNDVVAWCVEHKVPLAVVSANSCALISERIGAWDFDNAFSYICSVAPSGLNKVSVVSGLADMHRAKRVLVFEDSVRKSYAHKNVGFSVCAIKHPLSAEAFENAIGSHDFSIDVRKECQKTVAAMPVKDL